MDDREFAERAARILHNMALENTGGRSFFRRWTIHHEPLRNDAANLLRARGFNALMEDGTQYVGDTDKGVKDGA